MTMAAFGLSTTLSAQWDLTGNGGTTYGTHFLGTTNGVRFTLRTDNQWRLVCNETETATLGAFSLMPTNGFVGISPNSSFWNGPGPFSRLHLAEGSGTNYQSLGYRPWMRNGVTFTGNSDQAYIGHKYTYANPLDHTSGELNDYSDLVVQWSDNPGTWLSDRMRFIFTSEYSSTSATGNSSLEGLEAMQLFPAENGTEVLVGIGDWYAGGVNPSERLDILDRTVRIRRLVPDYEDQSLLKFVVTDDNGRLHWRNLPTGGGTGCEWTMNATAPNDLWTAEGVPDPSCPDSYENVGIGIANTSATGPDRGVKLYVLENTPGDPGVNNVGIRSQVHGDEYGINDGIQSFVYPLPGTNHVNSTGLYSLVRNAQAFNRGVYALSYVDGGYTTDNNIGVEGLAHNDGGTVNIQNIGVKGVALSANRNYGGLFRAESGGGLNVGVDVTSTADLNCSMCTNYGVRVLANGSATIAGSVNNNIAVHAVAVGNQYSDWNVGVYAQAYGANGGSGAPGTHHDWAFWSQGDSYITGGTWQASDAMFKTDVETIEDPLEKILGLTPKSYFLDTTGYDYMNFPSTAQFGFLADSAEQMVPELVREVYRPADYDSLGVETAPAITFKAMNYTGLIPLLIGAVQEQNATIAQLQTQMAVMQAQLAVCCTSVPVDDTNKLLVPGSTGNDAMENEGRVTDQLRIQPNPFSTSTTITYTLAGPGKVRLIVSTTSGRQLRVLEEAQRAEGTFTYEWNTSDLASGVYNVMLLVDGAPVVQKAVKIER